jgi:hypothetical protein
MIRNVKSPDLTICAFSEGLYSPMVLLMGMANRGILALAVIEF